MKASHTASQRNWRMLRPGLGSGPGPNFSREPTQSYALPQKGINLHEFSGEVGPGIGAEAGAEHPPKIAPLTFFGDVLRFFSFFCKSPVTGFW